MRKAVIQTSGGLYLLTMNSALSITMISFSYFSIDKKL